ncbi:MAG: ATP-binding cassette domain-containing protein [Actinobacteria bacterium]|nr:ATP-binding cassette domain-containing protein [Actinomycetota bacterium]
MARAGPGGRAGAARARHAGRGYRSRRSARSGGGGTTVTDPRQGAISYRGAGARYPEQAEPAVSGVDLEVRTGEILLVTGSSGSGKSTLLRMANGLVPHSTGGRLEGDVVTAGRSVRTHRPRDLADVVGFVHQDPEAQFVVDRVEDDVAFVLENLGVDPVTMRRRVEEVLDALGVAHLRDRSPGTLSGGERQRCAIAGALAAAPTCLVLDEPTSQLDPQGADDVLAAVARLNADLGTTILMAEHRLERAGPLADRTVIVEEGRIDAIGAPEDVLVDYEGAPEVTKLGALLGWEPRPLTVREARARARQQGAPPGRPPPDPELAPGEMLVGTSGVDVDLGGRPVLRGAALVAHRGEVVVLMGRNGSGKTTLLRVLADLLEARRGEVTRRGRVAYVPQDPNTLLYAPTVRAELEQTLRLLGEDDRSAVDRTLATFGLTELADRHPRSLSGGERQRVAIAAVAVGGAEVLLLDEPTRGIDAAGRAALEGSLAKHTAAGGAAVVATHDVELAARIASRAVVLGNGEVVAAGPARDVLSGSLFAPQVLRVVPPFLTVEEVAAAVDEERGR